jgi:uncharacterized linocin/CFP29 family protein
MTQNNPQVPWTDDQWARVNQVIQEEATSARVAAKFLPLYGPLPPDADFVRNQGIRYLARTDPPPNQRTVIDDKITIQLATLQVKVNVRGAQMADPEMTSVLALFRRAANVLARLEDVVVFRGLEENPAGGVTPIGGADPDRLPPIWEITGGDPSRGLWESPLAVPVLPNQWIPVGDPDGEPLVYAVSDAIGRLEGSGHFGPFAAVLGQKLFLAAQTPEPNSLVLPQDRIIPFLGGGPLLRSSTLTDYDGRSGVIVALGGAPVELVVAKDVSFQFLQATPDPQFLFRVHEKIRLLIKEPDAIIKLYVPNGRLR